MKNNYLIVFTLSLFLFNCKNEKAKDFLVISGKVENFKQKKIKISGYNFNKNIRFHKNTKTFSDTLRNFKTGHYALQIDKRVVNMYLSSFDDLNLIIDAKMRIKDPIFEGQNEAINNYLHKKRKKHSFILGNIQKLFALDEHEFLSKMDKYKSSLDDLAENGQLPEDYLKKERRNIHYEFVRNIKNYQPYHRMLYGNNRFIVSKYFPSELVNDIDINQSNDYINSISYRLLVKELLEKKASERKSKKRDFNLAYLETIHVEVSDTLVKNDLLHNAAKEIIYRVDNLKEYYKKYMLFSSNEKNKKEITKIYNKLKLTAKGEASPKFKNLYNYDGTKTSLDDLIGNGKYKYIDLWATWCGICKKETPLLKRLEQKYHNKNIEFISISVDKKQDKQKWINTIEDRELSGIQLFAGETKEDFQFTKDYLIKGLPRFILLDPNGKIITSNAPRPSENRKLTTLFKEQGIHIE